MVGIILVSGLGVRNLYVCLNSCCVRALVVACVHVARVSGEKDFKG